MIVRCRHCGLDVEAPPGSLGRVLRCPSCQKTFPCEVPKATVVGEPATPPGGIILEDELPEPPPPLPAHEPIDLTDQVAPAGPASDESPPASLADALAEMGGSAPRPKPKENPRQWCVVVDGVPAVALTYRELVARAREGKVKPKTKVYYAPKDVTVPARDIPGLFPDEDARRAEREARQRPARRPLPSSAAAAAALDQMADTDTEAEGEDEHPSDVPPPPGSPSTDA